MNQNGERDTGNDAEGEEPATAEDEFPGSENLRKYKMLSVSDSMKTLFEDIDDVAPTDVNVLIRAETGTGKELVSRAIHNLSPRKDKPFNTINCSAFPRELLENELFGHEKGAYTGAHRRELGILEVSNGGTVLLDEIGHMDMSLQPKLLRVLEEKKFRRLGSSAEIENDVRFISATSRSRDELEDPKVFLPELYYRLTFPIYIPPLRERGEDIPLLIEFFIDMYNKKYGKEKKIYPEAMYILKSYTWPGNVRELESVMDRLVIKGNGDITAELLQTQEEFRSGNQNGDIYNRMFDVNSLVKILGISEFFFYSKMKAGEIPTEIRNVKKMVSLKDAIDACKKANIFDEKVLTDNLHRYMKTEDSVTPVTQEPDVRTYSITEMSRISGISINTFYNAINGERLKSYKLDDNYTLSIEDVLDYCGKKPRFEEARMRLNRYLLSDIEAKDVLF